MFTDKAQEVIDRSKDYAFSGGAAELAVSHLLAAVGKLSEPGVLLAECFSMPVDALRAACPDLPDPVSCPGKLPLADRVRLILLYAKELADDVPDRYHPGMIDLRHLVAALAASPDACALLGVTPMLEDDASALVASWYENEPEAPRLEELTDRLRAMRAELLTKVFGQDHAVHAFVEGLFNAEVVAAADEDRRRPRALFVFAGPPGVGKTFLAELGAAYLDRPFKRFDMTSYAGRSEHTGLTGTAKSYAGAHPGQLTEFVEKNPNAVLLFDEIEKVELDTIHLFLQLLDAGILEDKYHERNVSFRDTTIIFTTNAGRKLYERPNESGVHAANAAFHRKTILDALENEIDPRTTTTSGHGGRPVFPAAICSRMATGYPVLFNHLRVNELERVVQAELARVAALFEKQYYKQITFDELLPITLVLREGARTDARTLRSQAETFVKTELFKFCQLFKADRLEEVLDDVDSVRFTFDQDVQDLGPDVRALFEQPDKPQILLVAAGDLVDLYRQHVDEVDWWYASNADDALEVLAEEEIDMVLVDLWLGRAAAPAAPAAASAFDHTPAASSGLDQGQEVLRKIRERAPGMPVYLLSLAQADDDDAAGTVDEELLLACVRGGGARGMLITRFVEGAGDDWVDHRDRFAQSVLHTCRRLYREKAAARMGQERKVLAFDTIPDIHDAEREISIRLRSLRLTRAISAADASELVSDVERPTTRFDDVIGADEAKKELRFFIDYLRNPRRYMALGLDPPKGALLYGPPGTGKTMLARAMAGESNVAFVAKSAGSFVTVWQGSGPQSVRDLFDTGRRYAPSIVFIDELDTIGRERSGSQSHLEEQHALNEFLAQMDGFISVSPDRPVFILGATNAKVEPRPPGVPALADTEVRLDQALVRRFTSKIKVDLPDRKAREEYLTRRLTNRRACTVSPGVISVLAERSMQKSINDLAKVIELASRNAVQAGSPLTDPILEDAFETTLFGEAKTWDPEFVRRVACHESGHTVMYWLSGWWAAWVTIVARAEHGGYMQHCADEVERPLKTRTDLLASVRVSLGGRAAELLYYGEEGLSTGIQADLEGAKEKARQMVSDFWMQQSVDQGSAEANQAEVNRILTEQMDETMTLLQANRHHLDTLVDALSRQERLTADDLKQILPPIPGKAPAP